MHGETWKFHLFFQFSFHLRDNLINSTRNMWLCPRGSIRWIYRCCSACLFEFMRIYFHPLMKWNGKVIQKLTAFRRCVCDWVSRKSLRVRTLKVSKEVEVCPLSGSILKRLCYAWHERLLNYRRAIWHRGTALDVIHWKIETSTDKRNNISHASAHSVCFFWKCGLHLVLRSFYYLFWVNAAATLLAVS